MRRVPVRALIHHTAVSPDGRYAVAVHSNAGGISIIDLAEGEVMKTVDLQPELYHFTIAGKLHKLYVSSRETPPKVRVIDPETLKIRGEIDNGRGVTHQMDGRHDSRVQL